MAGNSKWEGKEMLLLMMSTFVVVVIVVIGHSQHNLFVMYAEVMAQTGKCAWDK